MVGFLVPDSKHVIKTIGYMNIGVGCWVPDRPLRALGFTQILWAFKDWI